MRILVVDDEAVVSSSIKMVLGVDGHSVSLAGSPREALEQFNPADFDVIITDFEMQGLQGDQLALLFKERAPEVPVVMITAYAEMLDSWSTDLSAVDHVIGKPFKLDEVRQALGQIAGLKCV